MISPFVIRRVGAARAQRLFSPANCSAPRMRALRSHRRVVAPKRWTRRSSRSVATSGAAPRARSRPSRRSSPAYVERAGREPALTAEMLAKMRAGTKARKAWPVLREAPPALGDQGRTYVKHRKRGHSDYSPTARILAASTANRRLQAKANGIAVTHAAISIGDSTISALTERTEVPIRLASVDPRVPISWTVYRALVEIRGRWRVSTTACSTMPALGGERDPHEPDCARCSEAPSIDATVFLDRKRLEAPLPNMPVLL